MTYLQAMPSEIVRRQLSGMSQALCKAVSLVAPDEEEVGLDKATCI